ncbi:MAG TPA: Ig-like domain-containing protein [Terriglobales bacterium]|nr:Ig-like domain-containing protein [Terriglobales bacterium]
MQAVKMKNRSKLSNLSATIVRGAAILAALSGGLMAARPAQAQTEAALYNFAGTPDGENAYGGITFNGGNIFGTTYDGGLYGYGSVFELTPNGSGGWNESVLYSFCAVAPACSDGQNPTFGSVVFDANGNLYGTAYAGGSDGNGVVFELSPPASGSTTWTYHSVYSFTGEPDAANPVNGLIIDGSGDLFGTAYNGGAANNGAVFEVSPNGSGGWTETVPASINALYGGLVMNSTGVIFGTTSTTVFELGKNSGGTWVELPIFTFTASEAAAEGEEPNGTLWLDSKGNLYGTTVEGGKNNDGVVYKLTLQTNGSYKYKVLYTFGAAGTMPYAGVVGDANGNLYGTTTKGGKDGAGTVYTLAYNATSGAYAERTSQNFIGENGAVPYAGVIYNGGYLYGTTYLGGSDGDGLVYQVNPAASVTKTTCVSSVNPSTLGEAVTFTATVTPAPPDGEPIVFEPVGQSNMVGGVATFTVSDLKAGKTNITAVYGGDLNFLTSHSVTFQQVVTK